MARKTNDEISAILGSELNNALGYMGGKLSDQRRRAMRYYMGEPYGDEISGRSKVRSTDVADVIEWIMPQLMKIFTSGERVVLYNPQGPEDVESADQATEYVNWIYNRDNPGFETTYNWFKDALLYKNGTVKIYWDDSDVERHERYSRLTDAEFEDIASDDAVTVTAHTAYPDPDFEALYQIEANKAIAAGVVPPPMPEPPTVHDIEITRVINGEMDGRVKIEPVPPEELLVERRARSLKEANFVAHRTRKTRSDLIDMGFDKKVVETLPVYDDALYSDETQQRFNDVEDWYGESSVGDPASQYVWLYECYAQMDMNNDGTTSLWQVFMSGHSGYEVLAKEPADCIPFATLSPILVPHRWHGRSVAEYVEDIQRIKSTVWRQMLDNMYGLNNNSNVVSVDAQTRSTMSDLLVNRVNRQVRVKGDARAAIMPMPPVPIIGMARETLEYTDQVREERTGVTKYNQGLDADTLNKTAMGMSQILTQAQMRIELIARVFAETGVKECFDQILALVTKHQRKARVIKIREEWVPIDPTSWRNSMDLTTNVGLGSGDRQQMVSMLSMILQQQKEAMAVGGAGGMVNWENIYNTLEKIVEAAGLKTVDPYFNDPKALEPAPPRPDPAEIALQQQAQLDAAKMELERQKLALEAANDREKNRITEEDNERDFLLAALELRMKYQSQMTLAEIKAEVEGAKIAAGLSRPVNGGQV